MSNPATQGKGRYCAGAANAVIVVGGLVIVALVGVIVALVMSLNRSEPEALAQADNAQRAIVVHEDTVEEQLEQLIQQPPVEPGYYQVSMTMDWTFPDGASPSTNAYVQNRETNTNDVYFDILLRDTEEVIYESPVIPLGNYINNITLDRDLDAGEYRCVIVYHLLDESQETVSTLTMGLTIAVEN